MNNVDKIKELIRITGDELDSFIGIEENGRVGLIDPLDKSIIRGHYGDSHYYLGLLLKSLQDESEEDYIIAKKYIINYLSYFDQDSKLPDYHNDFNLFALCMAYDLLKNNDEELSSSIKDIVLRSYDSKHNTINWLPMRIFVNNHRFEWTNDYIYKKYSDDLLKVIKDVTYKDGFIDDLAPKGNSYNLQYNIATLSGLLLINTRNNINYDFSIALGALINATIKDGDINYFGRGTNQIFAWGMWIFLLSITGQESSLQEAIKYLENRLPTMIANKNIMLNNHNGVDKYLWWDYHYSSVYLSHLYFWLNLSIAEYHKNKVEPENSKTHDSGVKILRNKTCEVVLFEGRKRYLSEKGPILCSLWIDKYGMLFKGGFGPWQGSFSQKYLLHGVVLRNYMGLIQVKRNRNLNSFRIFKRLHINHNIKPIESIQPLFVKTSINLINNGIQIIYSDGSSTEKILNIPVLQDSSIMIESIIVTADNKQILLRKIGTIEAQYGTLIIYQTESCTAKEWCLSIT